MKRAGCRCVFFFFLGFIASVESAETWVWDGESPATIDWSDKTNWVGDDSVPISDSANDLIFGNSLHSFSSNDLGWFCLRDLTFVGSSTLSILGAPLEVFRSIVNSSSVEHAIANPIVLGADLYARAATANLYLAGTNHNEGYTLKTEGAAEVYIQSLVGSGGLEVYGPGQTALLGPNTYSGATRVYGGTLLAGPGSLALTAFLDIQGSATALLNDAVGLWDAGTTGRYAQVSGASAQIQLSAPVLEGHSNGLIVTAGGRADAGSFAYGNGGERFVVVEGPGSRLTANITMGGSNAGARLVVTNGGTVAANMLNVTSRGGQIIVSDAGSAITGTSLMASAPAEANRIEVSHGAELSFSSGIILDGVAHTVRVDGAGSTLRTPALAMGLMEAASGHRVEITGGAQVYGGVAAAYNATDTRIVVAGTGTLINSFAGATGLGLLGTDNAAEIRDGAVVLTSPQVAGTRNQLTISGAGSAITGLGPGSLTGEGNTFVVSNGAHVAVAEFMVGGSGHRLEITGWGTEWTNAGAFSMMADQTRLLIGNGARMSSPSATLAGASSQLEIIGSNSAWRMGGELGLGVDLRVAEGGQLSSAGVSVNGPVRIDLEGAGTVWSNAGTFLNPYADSELWVADGARWWNGAEAQVSGNITVTGSGAQVVMVSSGAVGVGGAFNVLDGASVSVGSLYLLTSSGRLLLDGGTMTAGMLTSLGGSVEFRGGTLNVSTMGYSQATPFEVGDGSQAATLDLTSTKDGTHRFAGGLIINPNAQLTGQGVLDNDVTVYGALSPGHSAGQIIVASNLTFDVSAETIMEIYGKDPGEHDVVQAASITYGGELRIVFSGFTPTNGARFQIFDAGSYSGAFSQTNVLGVYAAGFDSDRGEVFVIAAVPEPASLAYLISGLVLLHRWRTKRSPPPESRASV